MERLHTSYGNLGSWRLSKLADSIVIKYNPAPAIITCSIVCILCGLSAYWLFGVVTDTNQSKINLAIGTLITAAVLYPTATLLYIASQYKKGDLIHFTPSTNTLNIPRIGLSIDNAMNRVYFSQEHFTDGNNHFFEYNIVIDGERHKFLSSSVSNGFKSVRSKLDKLGFHTQNQKIRL